jgi:hypothetical protein
VSFPQQTLLLLQPLTCWPHRGLLAFPVLWESSWPRFSGESDICCFGTCHLAKPNKWFSLALIGFQIHNGAEAALHFCTCARLPGLGFGGAECRALACLLLLFERLCFSPHSPANHQAWWSSPPQVLPYTTSTSWGEQTSVCDNHTVRRPGKFPGTKPHQVLRGRGSLCKRSAVKELPSLIFLFHLPESPPLNLSLFPSLPPAPSSFYSLSRTANLAGGHQLLQKSLGSVAEGNGIGRRRNQRWSEHLDFAETEAQHLLCIIHGWHYHPSLHSPVSYNRDLNVNVFETLHTMTLIDPQPCNGQTGPCSGLAQGHGRPGEHGPSTMLLW